MTEADDAALVERAWRRRQRAFDVLVERHRRQVYQVCYRFVGNHEDASDLAQDVFLRAYRALGTFKGHSAFSTWLYRVAVNVCLNRVAVEAACRPSRSTRASSRSQRASRRIALCCGRSGRRRCARRSPGCRGSSAPR